HDGLADRGDEQTQRAEGEQDEKSGDDAPRRRNRIDVAVAYRRHGDDAEPDRVGELVELAVLDAVLDEVEARGDREVDADEERPAALQPAPEDRQGDGRAAGVLALAHFGSLSPPSRTG